MTIDGIEPALIDLKEGEELLRMRVDKLEELTLELEHSLVKMKAKLEAIDMIFYRAVRK